MASENKNKSYSETLKQQSNTNNTFQHQRSGIFNIHLRDYKGLDDLIVVAIQRKTNIKAVAIVDLPPTPQRRNRAFQVVFNSAEELARILAVGTYQFAGASHRIQPMSTSALTISCLRVDGEISDEAIDQQLSAYGKLVQPTKRIMDRIDGFGAINKGKRIAILRPTNPDNLPPSTLTVNDQTFPIIYTIPGLNMSNLQRDKIEREKSKHPPNDQSACSRADPPPCVDTTLASIPNATAPPPPPPPPPPQPPTQPPPQQQFPQSQSDSEEDNLPVHPENRFNRCSDDIQPPDAVVPTKPVGVLPPPPSPPPPPPPSPLPICDADTTSLPHPPPPCTDAVSTSETTTASEAEAAEQIDEYSDTEVSNGQKCNSPVDDTCDYPPSSPCSQDVATAVSGLSRSPYPLRKAILTTRDALESTDRTPSKGASPQQCEQCGLDETGAVSHEKCRGCRVPYDKVLEADRRCPHGARVLSSEIDSFEKARTSSDVAARIAATRKCATTVCDMYQRSHPKYMAAILRNIGAITFGNEAATKIITFACTPEGAIIDMDAIQRSVQHLPGVLAVLESQKLMVKCSNKPLKNSDVLCNEVQHVLHLLHRNS